MDDSDEDDMPLVFKRNNGTTKQTLRCPPSQKPTPSFKVEKRLINLAANPEESEYDSDDSEDSDDEILLSSKSQKSNAGASTRKAHDFDENKPIGSKVQRNGTPAGIAGRRVVGEGSYTPVEMDDVLKVRGNLEEIRGVDTSFEGMDVPDLGVEADRARREKAERKAKMAELAKKRKSEAWVPVVESVAKKVRATAEAARVEEQDFNSLVAFSQKAISQGYLAMNAAFEKIEKEKSDLEARVKALEENTTKAEAKFLAAEKARVEMAMSVQARVDAEKKNITEVEIKLAEAQAKVIDVALQIKKLEAERTRLEFELKKSQQGVAVKVAEEARKLKMEYHAQLKTEVNGFYRDGWSEASQFCRASADHKVWDVEGFIINLPYPEAAIPELKPLTPRAESDAEGEEMEGFEGQEDH